MKRLSRGAWVAVDAAAVLDAYVPGVEPAAARAAARMLADHAEGHVRLVGPLLLPWEVMAVLRRRAAGRFLANAEASERWELYRALGIRTAEFDPEEAFAVSEALGCSAYDAAYLGLAIREGLPLITERRLVEDARVTRRHPRLRGLALHSVTEWPGLRPEGAR